jgi:hypothetical protein
LDAARSKSFLEVNLWGLLYYGLRIDRSEEYLSNGIQSNGDGGGNRAIHLYQFIGYMLLLVHHSGKMLQRMGYSGPLHVEVALAPIRGVTWLRSNGFNALSPSAGSELDDSITFSLSLSSDELISMADRVAMENVKLILFAVNLPGLVDTQAKLRDLVGFGYDFNGWARPTNFDI